MIDRGELRTKVLDALDQRVKQFKTREELYPLRVPSEPLALDRIVEQALGPDRRRFDPHSLRARTLLHLEWSDGSAWDASVIALPSGLRLYCDSGEEEARVLASGGRNAADESDRLFLELLAQSGGQHFGIEMSGGPPTRVRCSMEDHDFLVDVFVELFEVSGMEHAIRSELAAAADQVSNEGAHRRDFHADVKKWLEHALR